MNMTDFLFEVGSWVRIRDCQESKTSDHIKNFIGHEFIVKRRYTIGNRNYYKIGTFSFSIIERVLEPVTELSLSDSDIDEVLYV